MSCCCPKCLYDEGECLYSEYADLWTVISVVGQRRLKNIKLSSIQNWQVQKTSSVRSVHNVGPNIVPNGSSSSHTKKSSTARCRLNLNQENTNADRDMSEKLHKNDEECSNDAFVESYSEVSSLLKTGPHCLDNTPFNWDKVALELRACRSYEEVVSVVERYVLPQILLGRKYTQTLHDVVCQVAMIFFPSDHPPDVVPIKTFGDGNCFFRAVSHALFGTEERHVKIHVRIVFEAVLNEKLHLSNDYLSLGIQNRVSLRPNLRSSSSTIVTRYCLYSGDDSITGLRLNEKEIQHVYRQDVLRISKVYNYTGIWQFHQAAEIAQMPIGTVYPDKGVNMNIRVDLNRIILPSNRAFHNKLPIYIMWSPLKETSKAYNVKHFVVLFKPFRYLNVACSYVSGFN